MEELVPIQSEEDSRVIRPFRHQSQLIRSCFAYNTITNFFLIGGYSCGKTRSAALLILYLASRYWKKQVTIGIGGPTITFMRKTIIAELTKLLILTNSEYRYDQQQNTIQIGLVTFQLVPTEQPKDIYGYNFSAFIIDELDELEQTKAVETFIAATERTRIPFPDGRQPFTVFPTTAQGYKGAYQIIESLKDAGTGYLKIRGRTYDNTVMAKSTIRNLEALYSENERLAFLEGHFVNLTAGRVYPDYDESLCYKEPTELHPNDTIYVGQDVNTGFSKAVAIVIRGEAIHVVKEWSFKAIGDAPNDIRRAFPTQRIVYYPDASSKEIMFGYQMEFDRANIELAISTVNPSIIERIFFVNKLFKLQRLSVDKTLRMLPMALKTRQFDENGKPEKGKGEQSPDHICFIGATKILTRQGWKKIKKLKAGDEVMTRAGWKRVVVAEKTGVRKVSRYAFPGGSVVATPDHPVITAKGKKPIGFVTPSDVIYLWDKLRGNAKEHMGLRRVRNFVRRRAVYNCTVEGEHEYFANGLLVSNCDALEYCVYRVVQDDPAFYDLFKLSPSMHHS